MFPKIKVKEFNSLPLPMINKTNNKISEIVLQIVDIKKANVLSNTIELETEIDNLVYQLYDLTEDEIKIIEGK